MCPKSGFVLISQQSIVPRREHNIHQNRKCDLFVNEEITKRNDIKINIMDPGEKVISHEVIVLNVLNYESNNQNLNLNIKKKSMTSNQESDCLPLVV